MDRPPAVKDRPSPRRGRPRDPAARAAVLDAARALLDEGGLGAVTVEALAARAGVSKPTIYRTWPNAHAVAMSALMASAPEPPPDRAPASGLLALRRQLHQIVDAFGSRTGRHVPSVLAASDPHTELSKVFRNRFILARRAEGREWLTRAVALGEVRRGIDVEVVLDLLYAPIFYRLLVGHAPLDRAFVDAMLRQAIDGLRPRRAAAR